MHNYVIKWFLEQMGYSPAASEEPKPESDNSPAPLSTTSKVSSNKRARSTKDGSITSQKQEAASSSLSQGHKRQSPMIAPRSKVKNSSDYRAKPNNRQTKERVDGRANPNVIDYQ